MARDSTSAQANAVEVEGFLPLGPALGAAQRQACLGEGVRERKLLSQFVDVLRREGECIATVQPASVEQDRDRIMRLVLARNEREIPTRRQAKHVASYLDAGVRIRRLGRKERSCVDLELELLAALLARRPAG